MINNTLILVVLHLYYLLSDLSNMLLSVNLGMKSNQSKMFAQVAKVQLSVTFSPLTVTGRNTMRPNFTSSDNHVNIYRTQLEFSKLIDMESKRCCISCKEKDVRLLKLSLY